MNKLLLVLMSLTVLLAGCSSSVVHNRNGLETFSLHSSRGIGGSSVVINTNDQKYQNYTAEIGLPNGEAEMLARQRIYMEEQRRNSDTLYGGYGYGGYRYHRFGDYGYSQPGLQCQTYLRGRCYVYHNSSTGAMSTIPPGWGPQPTYTTLPPAR